MTFRVLTSHTSAGFATVAFTALSFAASAHAAGDPRGIWYDHNGRGAVEIKECASNASRLCGHVVYVKKARNKKRCGMQIIGNVRGNGRGWIYSPKRGRSFPLALKRLSNNRLRIVGNAGSFFTKTYIWKRAPDSVVNCGQAVVAKAKAQPVAKPVAKPAVETPQRTVAKAAAPVTQPSQKKTQAPANRDTDAGNASSATAALLLAPAAAAASAPTPETAPAPVAQVAQDIPATATPSTTVADDLTPPGGLSNGEDGKLGKLKEVINKFTGGKGLKGFKLKGKGRGKCKYRIPYVGRTIRVPCK